MKDTPEMIRVGDLTDEEQLGLARKATEFLTAFRWCAKVRESYLAFDIGPVLGVFLFHIEPRLDVVDHILWVVVGDVPPAFIVCDDAQDWKGALSAYVTEMQRWVHAVRANSTLDGIIPVNVSATQEHAEMLSSRLSFITGYILDGKDDRAP